MSDPSGSPVREYSRPRQLWNRIAREIWFYRLRRLLPRLVWVGDEVDVRITWPEDKLDPDNPNPFSQLFGGGLYEIEKQLRHMGIEFDKGMGRDGRDWEFDWSLKGPVHVTFRGRAKNSERRKEKHRLKVVA